MPRLQQIHQDLSADNERAFSPDNATIGLHVHVSVKGEENVNLDSPLGFATLQNVAALYGLFEDEKGRWLTVRRRDDHVWTERIRQGMEKIPLREFFPEAEKNDRLRYTPQQFTRLIYDAKNVLALKQVLTGEDDETAAYVTVNISLARDNKPTTIKFRQHHGTIDAVDLKWWVQFLVYLVKYSYFLAQIGFEVRDKGDLQKIPVKDLDQYSFVESSDTESSILDVISYPAEGKAHFAACAARHYSAGHEANRELDPWFIKKRARQSRYTGRPPGMKYDELVRTIPNKRYATEIKRISKKYKVRYLA